MTTIIPNKALSLSLSLNTRLRPGHPRYAHCLLINSLSNHRVLSRHQLGAASLPRSPPLSPSLSFPLSWTLFPNKVSLSLSRRLSPQLIALIASVQSKGS